MVYVVLSSLVTKLNERQFSETETLSLYKVRVSWALKNLAEDEVAVIKEHFSTESFGDNIITGEQLGSELIRQEKISKEDMTFLLALLHAVSRSDVAHLLEPGNK